MRHTILEEIIKLYPSQDAIQEDIQVIREAFITQVESSRDTENLWRRLKLLDALECGSLGYFEDESPQEIKVEVNDRHLL